MPADRNTNTLIRTYLQSRYSVTNQDVQALINRYLIENPNGLNDQTKVWKELQAAAEA
jgi:hypothetical protein